MRFCVDGGLLGVGFLCVMNQVFLLFIKEKNDPKIWFTSMKSLAEVLSDENRALLNIIKEAQPKSISGLAELTGRKQSNLSRTLKTMSSYGIVEMVQENRQVRPIVKATEFQILAS